MKIYSKILLLFILFFSILNFTHSSFISDLFDDRDTEIHYCQDDECWIDNWIDVVWDNVEWIVTDETASSYFQNIVKYLLWFVYLIAVAIIIYSWFNLLTWAWDEEKAKKSKSMIIYVIIWIAIIFLANSIVWFVVQVLENWN